jgi:hypothetical protein
VNFLISAKVPLILTGSGKFPLYLPDTINGLPRERSGIQNGSNCYKLGEDNMSETARKIEQDRESKASLLKHNYAKREYEIIKAGLTYNNIQYLELSTSSESRCSKASTVISARMIDDAVVNNFCIRKSTESGQIKQQ